MGAVLQSNQGLDVDDSFEVDVGVMRGTEAGGGSNGTGGRRSIINTDLQSPECSMRLKRSMVFIPDLPGQNTCAGRAVVVCMAKLRNMPTKDFKYLIRAQYANTLNPRSQSMRARKLYRDAGVSMTSPLPVSQLDKFEKHLGVQIVVISGDTGNTVIYKGYKVMKDKIFLYLKDNHYHSIINIKGFFAKSKICMQCLTVYPLKQKHSCKFMCRTCCREICVFDDNSVKCPDCNMLCRNTTCFITHKQGREYKVGAKKGEDRLSLCETFFKCPRCTRIIDRTKRDVNSHKCGEWYCTCCNEYVVNDHLCYYRIRKPKETSGRFLFYDFETSQDSVINCQQGYVCNPLPDCSECQPEQQCSRCRKCINCKRGYCGLKYHVPNFLVCQSACTKCKDDLFSSDSLCAFCGDRCKVCHASDKGAFLRPPCANGICGRRERVFKGDHTTRDFCQWLISPQHKDMIVIAHNSRSFDSHFILNYCVENSVFPDIIYNGSKIMSMTIHSGVEIRFIDSLNFLPMALKKLPGALNLAHDLKKGQFPHFFNTSGNWNAILPTPPPPKMYGFDYMKKSDRDEFLEWYKDVKDKEFDFQKEILEYTRSDVIILREACMKFRDLIMAVTTIDGCKIPGVDPFAHTTIASSAMQIIRQLMLYEEHDVVLIDGRKGRAILKRGVWTFDGCEIDEALISEKKFVKSPIPQIPTHGYGKHTNDSDKAIKWLEWMAHTNKRKILHSRNGGEYRIPTTRYHVDGYHEETKTVYEFLGCRFHGHQCVKDREKIYDPRTRSKLTAVYERTMMRLREIRSKGYDVITMWECHFDRMVKTNKEIQNFVASVDTVRPLKIRDSFFGGRVSPVKLFYEAKEGEKIRYLDVTSLYPYINLVGRYPTNHCKIFTEEKDFDYTLQSYYGLVKLRVLPPRGLYIPVLPVRCGGKLKFPLCSRCSQLETVKPCTCTESQRAITGTWTTEEVKAALQAGYKVVKIFEVYHYDETSTDPTSPGSIFEEYVKMFLKVKQQASGYPPWVKDESDKDSYIASYSERQGIILDKESIQFNPSLRLISKLYANSAWGKFVQRTNMNQVVYVKNRADLAKIRNDPTKSVTNFHVINDDYIAIEFCKATSYEDENTFTNEIIGTFTTSLARLHLLKILQKTDKDTLYFDTDSVIFKERDGCKTLEVGDLLGELTDELPQGTHITTFLSSGPKSYCYKLSDDSCTMKIKGITLNHTNSQIIDFDVMKNVVTGHTDFVKLPPSMQISRVKHQGIVYNRPHSKIFRKVFTKRAVVKGTYDTIPYGY